MKYTHRLLSLSQPAARQLADLHPMLGQRIWSESMIDRLLDAIRQLDSLKAALEGSTESVELIGPDEPLPWEERNSEGYEFLNEGGQF